MNTQQPNTLYAQSSAVAFQNVEIPIIFKDSSGVERAPTSSDVNFPLGKTALIPTTGAVYTLAALTTINNITTATWTLLGGSSSDVNTLSGDSGTATPVAGNIQIAGSTNEIDTVGSSGVVTLGLSSTLVAPGSITATTSLTATLGDITATDGNIVRGTAGNKDVYSSVATTTAAGDNSAGTVTLASGTATVATTAVTSNSIIRLYRQGIGSTGAAALGYLTLGTIVDGTSFVITAVQPADATSAQTTDVSVVAWEIVN